MAKVGKGFYALSAKSKPWTISTMVWGWSALCLPPTISLPAPSPFTWLLFPTCTGQSRRHNSPGPVHSETWSPGSKIRKVAVSFSQGLSQPITAFFVCFWMSWSLCTGILPGRPARGWGSCPTPTPRCKCCGLQGARAARKGTNTCSQEGPGGGMCLKGGSSLCACSQQILHKLNDNVIKHLRLRHQNITPQAQRSPSELAAWPAGPGLCT